MKHARDRYFRWLVEHRIEVLALNVALFLIVAVGAGRVPIDYTMEQFFPGWGPERERYDRYKQSFHKEDAQISVFWKDSRPAGIAVYRDLQQAAGYFEEVGLLDVQWLGSVEVAEVVKVEGESALHVHTLIEEERLSDAYVRQVLAEHRDDHLYRGYLWNAEQTVFAIHGTLDPRDMEDDLRRREIDETLQSELEALAGDRAEFALSGVPITRSRIPKLLDEDQRLFVGAGLLVFLAVLFFFFRHAGQVVLCLASIVPAYLSTVALIGLTGKPVTVLTGFIPIIVLVVGGSDIVHLLSRYRQLRAQQIGNADAVVSAFSELVTPCFYTSLTTAIGFLSLVGTRIGIVMDFGIFTAVAIFLTYGFSMTLLPVLLSFYARRRFNDRGLQAAWARWIVDAAAGLALRPARKVLAAFAVVALIGAGLGLSLRVDSYLIDDLKKGAGVRRDLIWVEDNGFGIYQVVLFLRQNDERPLHHPDALRWMESFQQFVADEPAVVNSLALPDLLRQLRRAALDGDGADEALPGTVEEASQLIFLAELQDADFFTDVYRELDGEAQVIVMVRDAGSRVMLPFLRRVDRYLESNPPPVGSAYSTGTVKLIQNYSAQVLRNFGPSLVIAIVLIFAVMSVMFRSLRHGLVALIPNFFPLLVLLAVMKIAGFALKPSTILVCSISFGLAVDDTIHVLSRFRRAMAEGLQLRAALRTAVRDTGPAILMTTLIVSAGFSLLMGSRFEVLFLVGFLTMVSAIAAVTADLFVFPAIIAAAWRRSERRSHASRKTQEAFGYEHRYIEVADSAPSGLVRRVDPAVGGFVTGPRPDGGRAWTGHRSPGGAAQ
jgi:predicted RND superfamily exporter protein